MSIYRGRSRKDFYLASALYDSIEDNNFRAVTLALIEKGADPNIVLPNGIAPFHLAVGNDDANFALNVCRLILQHGGKPNIRSDDGLTPLHIAAAWGRMEIVRLLLNCGADPEIRDDSYAIPLEYAVEYKHFDIARLLHHVMFSGTNVNALPDDGEYNLTLDKIIINNGVAEAEYEVDRKSSSVEACNAINDLHRLPQTNSIEYVRNWCDSHALDSPLPLKDKKKQAQNENKTSITTISSEKEDESLESLKSSPVNQNVPKRWDEFVNCDRRRPQKQTNIIENVLLDYESSVKFRTRKSATIEHKNGLDIPAVASSNFCKFTAASRESGIETLPNTTLDTTEIQPHIVKIDYDRSDNCINVRETKEKPSIINIDTTSDYFTCNEISGSTNILEQNIFEASPSSDLKSSLSVAKSFTEDVTNLNCITNVPCNVSEDVPLCTDESLDQNTKLNIAEVYKYSDAQERIVLLERRLLVNQKCDLSESNASVVQSLSSKLSSLPASFDYDTDALRNELINKCGYNPGPITKTTKRVYLKKLYHSKKRSSTCAPLPEKVYSSELEKTLKDSTWVKDLSGYKSLEDIIFKEFSNPDVSRRWREGTNKSSFTYLLLDPRITNNLPVRAETLSLSETWQTFVSAIFYVGKGKRSRPYAHLYEATSLWYNDIESKTPDKKLEHILDIWRDDSGVVCLHIFQNIIPVEAYTREAAMITALKIDNIKNKRAGDFYGIASTWNSHQQKKLGVLLLYKAMLIFLSEGERQLKPADIN